MSAPELPLNPNQDEPDLAEPESIDEVPFLSFEQRVEWPPVMDLEDVAVALKRKSKRAARDLIRKASVPEFKLVGKIYVHRDDLIDRLRELPAEQAEEQRLEQSTRRARSVRRTAKRAVAALK